MPFAFSSQGKILARGITNASSMIRFSVTTLSLMKSSQTHLQAPSAGRSLATKDANLVVAGAGSGKTSTIIARIAYLLKEGLAQSGEILTIAFARDARKELEDRATLRIGDHGTSVATFHALGLQIIGESTGKRPNVSVLATDPHALNRFITEAIEDLLSQNDSDAICFCTEFGSEIVNPYDFESLSDYLEAVKKWRT